MGSCWCKQKSSVGVPVPGRRMSDSDSSTSEGPLAFIRSVPTGSMVEQYIIQMVHIVGSVSQSFDEQPAPLVKLHSLADNAEGWQQVIEALVDTVPIEHPLGPSAIAIIFDDCPLPAISTVADLLVQFNLGRERALTCFNSHDNKRNERNLLVILGSIAEKFAGPTSIKLMTEDVIEYLLTILTIKRAPELVLQALITVEKFGKTKQNKETLQDNFTKQEDRHPLIPLERYHDSEDLVWRQVGFCARWLLDNMFFVSGRTLSYTQVDMSETNALLDCKDTTEFLKVSPDGLEARCDAHTFESIRCTFQVDSGCWYYEAEILTPGVMQIGWATKETRFSTYEGYGIGDDNFSLAYDGCRRLLWHKAAPRQSDVVKSWVPGDILGCLIDVGKQEAIFSLNGVRLPVCKEIFRNMNEGFYAAASFMCFQGARFNFGMRQFRHAPADREFMIFNDHGKLTAEDKQVIPRWLYRQKLQMQEQVFDDDAICIICYDKRPDTIFSPCRHMGFCQECAFRITECPMCRERVWHYAILPL